MSEPSCPRCQVALVRIDVPQAPTANACACAACGGVWVDPFTARGIADALEPAFGAVTEHATRGAEAPVDEAAPAACPDCGQPMARQHLSGIEVDRCDAHGTWFDRGEIRRVGASAAARASLSGNTLGDTALDVALVGVVVADAVGDVGGDAAVGAVGAVGDVAADVAIDVATSGAADVVGELLGGVVDALASVFG